METPEIVTIKEESYIPDIEPFSHAYSIFGKELYSVIFPIGLLKRLIKGKDISYTIDCINRTIEFHKGKRKC